MVANATGGISIQGSIGYGFELAYLSHFKVQAAPSAPTGFGIKLMGVAGFGLHNIHIDGSSGAMAYGIQLIATQQGYIKGGLNFRARIGISLERTNDIGSNGVEISGVSFNDIDEGLRVAAVDDGSFHSNHLTFSRYGIHVMAGGSGSYTVDSNHFEGHASGSIFQEGGSTVIRNCSFYSPIELSILGGGAMVDANLLNGSVTFGAAVESSTFSNNWTFGAVSNSSASLLQFNNRSASGTPLLSPSNFPDAASFTSRAASAGDVLTLNPNPAVSGDWGMTINAPATGNAYVRLGNTTIAASGDGGLKLGPLTVDAGGALGFPAPPRFNGPNATTCPAANCATPYTWIEMTAADGTPVWMPVFK
jgi:hypothetical protein